MDTRERSGCAGQAESGRELTVAGSGCEGIVIGDVRAEHVEDIARSRRRLAPQFRFLSHGHFSLYRLSW